MPEVMAAWLVSAPHTHWEFEMYGPTTGWPASHSPIYPCEFAVRELRNIALEQRLMALEQQVREVQQSLTCNRYCGGRGRASRRGRREGQRTGTAGVAAGPTEGGAQERYYVEDGEGGVYLSPAAVPLEEAQRAASDALEEASVAVHGAVGALEKHAPEWCAPLHEAHAVLKQPGVETAAKALRGIRAVKEYCPDGVQGEVKAVARVFRDVFVLRCRLLAAPGDREDFLGVVVRAGRGAFDAKDVAAVLLSYRKRMRSYPDAFRRRLRDRRLPRSWRRF